MTRSELDAYADNVAANAQMPSISEEERKELESYSLDLMIGERLLLQEAKTQNIVASSQEVDSQLTMIMADFSSEEEFQQALAQSNITKQDLRESLEKQNIFIQLAQISVSEEEMMLLYESEMAEQEDAPLYETVKPLIRQHIE
ncbi:MAG: SurA N-terminal domain-containing protein, partial [bacterium]|nr:SurA N-terminal domain-containing protein [bacterium]